MLGQFNIRHRRHRRAMLVLVCALSLSTPAQAATDDMFGVMFRMMLVMMNVMSGAMLGNNNNSNWGNNWGGLNSFNPGMSAVPMMSGFGSPWSSIGTPWSSFGGSPFGMSPWGGSGFSPLGLSPWGNTGGVPFAAANPGYFPGNGFAPPYGGYGSPATYGAPGYRNVPAAPYAATSLLEGRWYGNSGEVLEIHGNRFQLRAGGASLAGELTVDNNIVNMYSPQTNTVTRYSFMRNQSQLLLNDGSGEVLIFRNDPASGGMRIF